MIRRKQHRHSNLERIGIYKFANIVEEDFGWIFREQPIADVGIDAYMEEVINGKPTGRIIALQIKSGESHFYFSKTKKDITFYFNETHYQYWIQYCIPVIVLGYLPEKGLLIWQAIQDDKISKGKKGYNVKMRNSFSKEIIHDIKSVFQSFFSLEEKTTDYKHKNKIWIEELNLTIKHGAYNSKYVFPVVKSGDPYLEQSINFQINELFFNNLYTNYSTPNNNESTSNTLVCLKNYYLKNFNGGISSIEYKIHHNVSEVLSFCISFTYIGAYPSYKLIHFCFDLKTGNAIMINQLLKPFKLYDLTILLSKLKMGRLVEKLNEIKKTNPQAASFIGTGDELKSYSGVKIQDLDNFKIFEDTLSFYLDYGFPFVVKSLEPENYFSFKTKDIVDFLNPLTNYFNIKNT